MRVSVILIYELRCTKYDRSDIEAIPVQS